MSIPRATCRLQLHRDFPFDAAIAIVPYLARLGISHVYASPILAARPARRMAMTRSIRRDQPGARRPAGLDRLSDRLSAP
jgi:hypothetical protein